MILRPEYKAEWGQVLRFRKNNCSHHSYFVPMLYAFKKNKYKMLHSSNKILDVQLKTTVNKHWRKKKTIWNRTNVDTLNIHYIATVLNRKTTLPGKNLHRHMSDFGALLHKLIRLNPGNTTVLSSDNVAA